MWISIDRKMEEYLNKPEETNHVVIFKSGANIKTGSWKQLLRQIIICSGGWNCFFIAGLFFGAPTVLIPQLRREANSTEAVSEEMASWLSTVFGIASVPWLVIIPIITGQFGRKYPFFAVTITCLISYIVFMCSTNTQHILIAEILQGPMYACLLTISIVIVTEYTSTKYRGMFLCLQPATFHLGMWVANALGTFFHWRTIAILGMICSLYNLFTIMFWCESPSWLAFNGQYIECTKAHRWLKGEDAESEKELTAMITSCKQNQEKQDEEKSTPKTVSIDLYATIKERIFYMPLILGIAVLLLYHTTGKLVCSMYAIDVINKTASESTAYMGMLLLDSVTVISLYIACVLTKYFKRRTMLLTGSMGGTAFLFMLALYLYLSKLKVIGENQYVPLTLLSLFSLVLSFGPMILCSTLYGELIPLRYRTAGMFISGIFVRIVESITLKTALQMFKIFDMHGTFLFYGITTSCINLFLYKYLPETKGKTLQQIEEYFIDEFEKENSSETYPLQSLNSHRHNL